MSTLSELIPSGGTQNNIEFVAQGTLANGQAVALRSDGKVEAVAGVDNKLLDRSLRYAALDYIKTKLQQLSGVATGQ